MGKSEIVILALIVLSFAVSIYFYPQFPEQIPSHWNVQGDADGYMSKFWGLFLMPLISVGLLLLFIAIPRIDPLKHNIEKFRKHYNGLVIIVIAFMLYVQLLIISWTAGISFNMTQALSPALGILFYYIGILLENTKMNWFVGIRTPWTLSSEKVWNKTHKIGGKLFRVAGIIAIIGVLFRDYAIWFIIVPVLAVAAYTVVYSYFEYQKLGRNKIKKN